MGLKGKYLKKKLLKRIENEIENEELQIKYETLLNLPKVLVNYVIVNELK